MYFINLINLNGYFKILFKKFSLDTYPIDKQCKILHSNSKIQKNKKQKY